MGEEKAPLGKWKDTIVRRTGRGSLTDECLKGKCNHTPEKHREMAEGVTFESAWKGNLIVDRMGVLLAGLIQGLSSFTPGNVYHAQGEGLVSWDVSLPDPTVGQIQLVSEGFRKQPDFIVFLDSLGGSAVAGPTDVLQYRTTYDFGEANGLAIREQGLFSGDATGVQDSGQMMNAINHARVDKDNTFQFIRTIEMEF